MNSSILNNKQRYAVIVLSVMLSLMVVWGAVQGATTISSNVSTTGTLSVTGTSALTGLTTLTGGYISSASSTVAGTLQIAGMIQASSTATSTFQNGLNLSTGCFSIAGTCIGLATSSTAANTWSALQTFTAGVLSTASSTFSGQTMFSAPLQASSTLLVAGASTLTGLSTLNGGLLSTASTTISGQFMVSSPLQASSTLLVTGLSNLTGFISSASSTVSANLSVSGALTASSTLAVTGVTTHYGDLNVNGYATTTASNGNFASAGNIVASSTTSTLKGVGVATSTPAAEFAADGSATTTAYLNTTKAATGACIEVKATNGSYYRMYIGGGDAASLSTTSPRGATILYFAVWEPGSCK